MGNRGRRSDDRRRRSCVARVEPLPVRRSATELVVSRATIALVARQPHLRVDSRLLRTRVLLVPEGAFEAPPLRTSVLRNEAALTDLSDAASFRREPVT
jgi:hypothetical protein